MRKEQITVTNNSVCANISSACPQQKNTCSIPESNYFRHSQPKPDVVPVEVISDSAPDRHTLQPVSTEVANKSHTIEVALNNITVRICNDADPGLLSKVLHVIQEVSC